MTAADEVEAQLATDPAGSRLGLATVPDRLSPLWRRMAEDGDIPSFFQLRSSSGRVLQTVAIGRSRRCRSRCPRTWHRAGDRRRRGYAALDPRGDGRRAVARPLRAGAC